MGRVLRWLGEVVEARSRTTLKDMELFEVGDEERRFFGLDFPILYRDAVEMIIKLDGFVGSCSCFVLGSIFTEPEMQIV